MSPAIGTAGSSWGRVPDRLAARSLRAALEFECPDAPGSAEEWAMVRSLAVSVCADAVLLGYAEERFGAWLITAQRSAPDPRGRAVLLVTVVHGWQRRAHWRAPIDATPCEPSLYALAP